MKRAIGTRIAVAVWAISSIQPVFSATFVDVQANNPQVAGDPLSNTTAVFPTNKQNEPTIALNPIDNDILLAGANDEQRQPPCGPGPVRGATAPSDCSFFPGVGTSGIYRSLDGGHTWTNLGLLDDQASWQSSALVSDGDPVMVYGPKPDGHGGFTYAHGARAYYAGLASYKAGQSPYPPTKAPEAVAVSYSDDNGTTWSAPVIVGNRNPNNFNDKESIWVDKLPASPYFGRVYVSWTQFRSIGGAPEPIVVSVSTDAGLSFSSPKQLSPAQNVHGRQGSVVRSAPDGTVYVAWEEGTSQVIAVSGTGGDKWARPVTIANIVDIRDPIPGSNFRTDSFPAMAVDAVSGAIYVAWTEDVAGSGRLRASVSADRGATWADPRTLSGAPEGYAFFPAIDIAPNGRVDVAYQALRTSNPSASGTGNATIDSWYVSHSGSGWSVPTKVTSASSDPAASAQNNLALQFWGDYNSLVSSNAAVWFIYTDARNGVGCAAVDAYQAGTIPKPAPGMVCPSQFGNSDVYVSVIQP